MRSAKPANGSHFPTAFEAFKGTAAQLRIRRTRTSQLCEPSRAAAAQVTLTRKRRHLTVWRREACPPLCLATAAGWAPGPSDTASRLGSGVCLHGGCKTSKCGRGISLLVCVCVCVSRFPPLQVEMKPLCINYWSTLLLKYKGRAVSTNIQAARHFFFLFSLRCFWLSCSSEMCWMFCPAMTRRDGEDTKVMLSFLRPAAAVPALIDHRHLICVKSQILFQKNGGEIAV